jgi:hypothetical protein
MYQDLPFCFRLPASSSQFGDLWLWAAPEFSHCSIAAGSFPGLDLKTEEGICQLLAHMWLQTKLSAHMGRSPMPAGSLADVPAVQFRKSGGGTTKKKEEVSGRMADCFLRQIEVEPTEVYGAGFRAAHAAVGTFGLETVLEHMRMHKTLPQLAESITAYNLAHCVAILMTFGDLQISKSAGIAKF